MKIHKTIDQMTDDELYLVYEQLEKRLISLLKQYERNNGTERGLVAESIRAESALEMFESQCALLNRPVPSPNRFWKEAQE